MNTFNLRLDVDKAAKGMRNQVVRIRKGDLNGTILVATLYDHGTKITTSGLTVDFVMLQPDREHYYRATATWSAANGTASVTLDESYAGSVAGDTDVAYFELRQGTQVIASTENFRISVLRSATDEGEAPAESFDDIIPAAVYAWLEDHPEATTTVQDDSLTTAKYKDHSVTRAKLAADALGNVLRGTATGAVATASDAYAAPPLGLTVDGKSVQDGTPTPSVPVAIDSVESVSVHVSADGTTDATGWPVSIDLQGHELRGLPDGTHDELVVDADGNVTLVQRVTGIGLPTDYWNKTNSNGGMFYRYLPAGTKSSNDYTPISTKVKGVTAETQGSMGAWQMSLHYISSGQTNNLYIKPDSTVSGYTASQFADWLGDNPITVYFAAATPVTIPLGTVELPTMPAPDLTAWAVTDPSTAIALDYERDANMALEEMEANIAPVERAVATANHATGSLMMLGGHLVKATTAIAIGEAVTIGTNVAATTVAAELALKSNA